MGYGVWGIGYTTDSGMRGKGDRERGGMDDASRMQVMGN